MKTLKSSPELYDKNRDKFTVKAKIYKIELVQSNSDDENDDKDDNDDNDNDKNSKLIVDIDRLKI